MKDVSTKNFIQLLDGSFTGVLSWEKLDRLWEDISLNSHQPWFVYQVGEQVPVKPLIDEALVSAITALNQLLHKEHDYHYCGIVYVDDMQAPSMIKVYDPNNLGSSCGCGGAKYFPAWVISLMAPEKIDDPTPLPNNRKHWWNKLFS